MQLQVCIWCCEHAMFFVWKFWCIKFHWYIYMMLVILYLPISSSAENYSDLNWSVHFKIVWKLLGYGWKKTTTTSNWRIIRLKLFLSHHHPLTTWPCHTHRQSLLAIPMLSFLEPSTTLASSLIAIFHCQNNTSSKCVRPAYIEIRCISSIHQYVTEDATKTLVNWCILSRLDCCNSLLAGYPQTVINPLQQVHNSATKLFLKSHRAENAKPLLKQLHWLPIEQKIKYKIACLCFQSITGTAPQYLAELVQIYIPSWSLCSSSDDRTFHIPFFIDFKRKRMVVVPFASLLSKSGILFLSLSITALPSLPSKLAFKLTSSNYFGQ